MTFQDSRLVHVSDAEPGIARLGARSGFRYRATNGQFIRKPDTLGRIRKLAIPPAWTDVWICPDPHGHIQATGRDAKGRKQYRYHPDFRAAQEAAKYDHVLAFARLLPKLRRTTARHLGRKDLSREKVLAAVVRLLELTLIRVGNTDYAKQNGSFGLTTLRDGHVEVRGGDIRFAFKGKSGREWKLKLADRRIAKVVRACQDLPGQHLFQYVDDDGQRQQVTSSDVNDYLRTVTGQDVTAKDFRTWAGTVLAALALDELEAVDTQTAAQRNVRAAITRVAQRLGNTPTICRQCYVHPEILHAYMDGELRRNLAAQAAARLRKGMAGLSGAEAAVLVLLERRLRRPRQKVTRRRSN